MSVEFGRVYDYRSGISVRYEHVNEEPSVVIERKRNKFVIGLSKAFAYAEDQYLVKQSILACRVLGFNVTRNDAFLIADIIHNHLDELVKLPPQQMKTQREIENELDELVHKHKAIYLVNGENILQ